MAIESPKVTADAVEISEYPDLARQYHVMGVPKTMINGEDGIEGALPERAFVDAVALRSIAAPIDN
jgi:predicted DsbA family dithiol-disulfide isomerase